MPHRARSLVLTAAMLTVAGLPAAAQQVPHADTSYVTMRDSALTWAPAQPPGFAAGMEMAVVRGNPTVAGQPYMLRLRFPDGYRFPPHFHPVAENVTVLEGEFLLAMGETANERLMTYGPGDFLYIAANHPHFGGARGRTTIQLHGMGPFEIIVVGSPQDRR